MPLNEADTAWIGQHLIVKPENAERWERLTVHDTIASTVAVLQNLVGDVERQIADEDHDPDLTRRRKGYVVIAKRRLREVKALQKELNIAANGQENAKHAALKGLMRVLDGHFSGKLAIESVEDMFNDAYDALEAAGVDLQRGGYLS